MENTNKKRYWLRGIVIVVFIWIAFSLSVEITSDTKSLWVATLMNDASFLGSLDNAVSFFPGSWIVGEVISYNFSSQLLRLQIILVCIVFYAFLGLLFGWLYGKIKSKHV